MEDDILEYFEALKKYPTLSYQDFKNNKQQGQDTSIKTANVKADNININSGGNVNISTDPGTFDPNTFEDTNPVAQGAQQANEAADKQKGAVQTANSTQTTAGSTEVPASFDNKDPVAEGQKKAEEVRQQQAGDQQAAVQANMNGAAGGGSPSDGTQIITNAPSNVKPPAEDEDPKLMERLNNEDDKTPLGKKRKITEKEKQLFVNQSRGIVGAIMSGAQSVASFRDGDFDNGVRGTTSVLGNASDVLKQQAEALSQSNPNKAEKLAKTAKVVGNIAGYANAITKGAEVGNTILQALGAPTTDNMTKTDRMMNSSILQMSGIGYINNAFGDYSDNYSKDNELMSVMGGSYTGSNATMDDAVSVAGKKYGLFSSGARKRANELIAEANRQTSLISDINDEATARRVSGGDLEGAELSYKLQTKGGYDQRYLKAAKQGAKIETKEFVVELSEVQEFKKGGTIENNTFEVILTDVPKEIEIHKKGGTLENNIEVISTNTTQKSVIPEGALHKNKHHLDQVGVDDSELTKKGIPVIDNNGEQQAEIELNEIIFTLEVTKELEKRYKEFYEKDTSKDRQNELALEAGKLLWKEIIYNTDDRTGLINSLKKGGNLTKNDDFEDFVKSLPENQQDSINFNIKRYWELYGKPKNFEEACKKGMYTLEKDGLYHASSVAYNADNDEYEFMKAPNHPTVWMEIESWYNNNDIIPKGNATKEQIESGLQKYFDVIPKKDYSEDWLDFRKKYILQIPEDGSNYKYIRKNADKKLNGGILTQKDIDYMVKKALVKLLHQ